MIIHFDFGHGGRDPGAIGNGIVEKTWVLNFGRKVRDYLDKYYSGFKITYSRNSDVFIPLAQRAQMANSAGADYFISFHLNAGGGTGFESYIYTGVGSRTVAYQNVLHREIVGFLRKYGIRDRGKKRKNLSVLRNTSMSAILLEMMFLDHPKDAEMLKDANFIGMYAEAVAQAIGTTLGLTKREIKKEEKPVESKEDKNKLPVADWASKDWEEAQANGYFDGSRPQSDLTRQEAAIVVNRIRHNFLDKINNLEARIQELEGRIK